ncbi:MAG: polyprenyl synthetase family protein [Planctomycetes bacterium]|nr:polyprenyl synthetase family protein [Planctomycetota bacterium]
MLEFRASARPGSPPPLGATLLVTSLYGPIERDLEHVELRLRGDLESTYPVLERLVAHVSQFRGKRLRPALLLLSARACGEVREIHYGLGAIVELIHTATLVHDDVLDEATLRRNIESLPMRWGNEMSVLFGDYLFARAFHLAADLRSQEALDILARASEALCLGEMLQTSERWNLQLSEEQYLSIIEKKTASLFGACCRLGAHFAGASPAVAAAFERFGTDFGLAFQIVDDFVDLTGDEARAGKSLGTDLLKGKLTLPLIRLLAAVPAERRTELAGLFTATEGFLERRGRVAGLLEEYGIREAMKEQAGKLSARARAALSAVPPSPFADDLGRLADGVFTL